MEIVEKIKNSMTICIYKISKQLYKGGSKSLNFETLERIVNAMKTLERNGKLYGTNDILTIE